MEILNFDYYAHIASALVGILLVAWVGLEVWMRALRHSSD